jgi:peroxin-4
MSSRSRLLKEIKEASRDTDPTIRLAPDGENLLRWSATLKGPAETPFETGTFVVRFSLPESYPLSPPRATFETKIFHPNVHWKTGEICLDILKDAWSPAWTLHSVCRAVLALLCNPEPDSPLNCDAGNMLRARDDIAYWSVARMYTQREAGGVVLANPFWPPIRADRERDDDERANGETSFTARRRHEVSRDSRGEEDDANGSGDVDGDGTHRKTGDKKREETEKKATVDARAAAAAAAAARFEASRRATTNETTGAG